MSKEVDEARKELLEAISARGEASTRLRHANIRKWGPFGKRRVREAREEFDEACGKVGDAFDAWSRAVKGLSPEDRIDEDLKREEDES